MLVREASLLRRHCVKVHNKQLRRRYSLVKGVFSRLKPDCTELERDDPAFFLVSSYAFWGSRRSLGGSRRTFERTLERSIRSALWNLYTLVRASTFAAWRCTEAPDDRPSNWEPVGPVGGGTRAVDVVTAPRGEPTDPVEGTARAGWMVSLEEHTALLFSLELSPPAAERLAEASRQRAWHDDLIDGGPELGEYERDVLVQSAAPGPEVRGLESLYFLPVGRRRRFPDAFRRDLVVEMIDFLSSGSRPWHVELAMRDADWINEFLRPQLEAMRVVTERRLRPFGAEKIEPKYLPRLADDETCFNLLGLRGDGTVDLDEFPPLDHHPVALLDIDEKTLEACNIRPDDVIFGARSRIDEAGGEQEQRDFDEELQRHRARLRWCVIADSACEHAVDRPWGLDYDELRLAAQTLFDPFVTQLSLIDILPDEHGMGRRIATALKKAGYNQTPLTVEDLPMERIELAFTPGVGKKSVKSIDDALFEQLTEWPRHLRDAVPENRDEARSEIEAGLDELEDLF